MAHSSKKHSSKHSSSKKSKKDSPSPYASSSKPSSSSRPTPLEIYVASRETHELIALGQASGSQYGQQAVDQFNNAWGAASGR